MKEEMMSKMSKPDREKLRAVVDAATQKYWFVPGSLSVLPADLDLIVAASPETIRALLDLVDELEGKLGKSGWSRVAELLDQNAVLKKRIDQLVRTLARTAAGAPCE